MRLFDLKITKVLPTARELSRGSQHAAAVDVAYCGELPVRLDAGDVKKLSTGWAFELPEEYAMLILPRSGLASKFRLRPVNTPGLLDADYRGELFIALENAASPDSFTYTVQPGDYIAQLLFVPIGIPNLILTSHLTPTERADGGFGSTEATGRRKAG